MKNWAEKDVKILVDALSGRLESDQKKLKRDLDYPLCDCLTKTPELKYHHKNCKYRIFAEREKLINCSFDLISEIKKLHQTLSDSSRADACVVNGNLMQPLCLKYCADELGEIVKKYELRRNEKLES